MFSQYLSRRQPVPSKSTPARDRSPLREQQSHGSAIPATNRATLDTEPMVSATESELWKQTQALALEREQRLVSERKFGAIIRDLTTKVDETGKQLAAERHLCQQRAQYIRTLAAKRDKACADRSDINAKLVAADRSRDVFEHKYNELKRTADNELDNERKRAEHLAQQMVALAVEKDNALKAVRNEYNVKLVAAETARAQLQDMYRTSVDKYNELKVSSGGELMASRQRVAQLEAQQKPMDTEFAALMRRKKHYKEESEMCKALLNRLKYVLKQRHNWHLYTDNRMAKAVQHNGQAMIDAIESAVLEVLAHKRQDWRAESEVIAADGSRQKCAQNEIIDRNADRMLAKPGQKILCPQCPKSYAFNSWHCLAKHVAARHPFPTQATTGLPIDTSASTSSSVVSNTYGSTPGPSTRSQTFNTYQ
ncbi:unnamed protein product, partial [Medioppia subpectinata]